MRPLDGVKVVESASYISIPFGTQILADLGATVTKVEPLNGEAYRRFGIRYGDHSLFFVATNQRKHHVWLDLKDETDMTRFREMLADADIWMTNWRPSVAPSLGFDEESFRRDFPQLVWVRVSGYGQTGPQSHLPAYDSILQARSGSLRLDPETATTPTNLIADKVSAMTAAQAASAALIARDRTGEGSIVDIAMLDALSYFNAVDVSVGHRMPDTEIDPRHLDHLASNAPLPTADGFLMISPVSGRQIRAALGVVDAADRWEHVKAGVATGDLYVRFLDIVRPLLLEKSSAEWAELLSAADVPAAPVMTIAEHYVDEQLLHNGLYETIEQPGVGAWRRPHHPAFFDGERAETDDGAAPMMPAGEEG